MKKNIFFIALLLKGAINFALGQSTGINPTFVTIPNTSSASTCATTIDKGKLYFNSVDNKMYYCNGSSWVDFSVGAFSLPYSGSGNSTLNLFTINNTTTSSTSTAQFSSSGTGFAVFINSNNATPKALKTYGGLQLMNIGEGTNKVLSSDASGNATWRGPVGFWVQLSSNTTIVDGTNLILTFNTELYDTENSFPGQYFIAPVTGLYHFDGYIDWTAAFTSSFVRIAFSLFTSTNALIRQAFVDIPSGVNIMGSTTFYMQAGQKAALQVLQSSGSSRILDAGNTFFTGYLVR